MDCSSGRAPGKTQMHSLFVWMEGPEKSFMDGSPEKWSNLPRVVLRFVKVPDAGALVAGML